MKRSPIPLNPVCSIKVILWCRLKFLLFKPTFFDNKRIKIYFLLFRRFYTWKKKYRITCETILGWTNGSSDFFFSISIQNTLPNFFFHHFLLHILIIINTLVPKLHSFTRLKKRTISFLVWKSLFIASASIHSQKRKS